MMELSFYNNGHKETYKNPLIDEIFDHSAQTVPLVSLK